MIVTTQTITCNFCGNWRHVYDSETPRMARKRLRSDGWRVLPHADQRGRLMDACPRRDEHHPAAVVGGSGSDNTIGADDAD